VPLLRVMREIYSIPRGQPHDFNGMKRFRHFVRRIFADVAQARKRCITGDDALAHQAVQLVGQGQQPGTNRRLNVTPGGARGFFFPASLRQSAS
jgi:hypothetical protein